MTDSIPGGRENLPPPSSAPLGCGTFHIKTLNHQSDDQRESADRSASQLVVSEGLDCPLDGQAFSLILLEKNATVSPLLQP